MGWGITAPMRAFGGASRRPTPQVCRTSPTSGRLWFRDTSRKIHLRTSAPSEVNKNDALCEHLRKKEVDRYGG